MRQVIIGAKVFTAAGPWLESGVVSVNENGNIDWVGPKECFHNQLAAGTEVVDGQGKWLFPGFIDAHCHVGLSEEGTPVEGEDSNEMTDPVTPHLKAIDGIYPEDQGFRDGLQGGVTTVFVVPGSANVLGGQGVILKTAGSWEERIVREPSGMKAALGENPKRVYMERKKTPMTRMASAALFRDALAKAQQYHQNQLASESKNDPLTAKNRPELDSKLEALVPVLAGKLPLRIHAHRSDDILTALRIADEFGLRPVIEHCTEGHVVAAILAKKRVDAVIGPIIVNRAKPEMRNISLKTASVLQQAGVTVAIMTDHPVVPLQYLALSAGLTAREGMSEEEALLAITRNPARILGIEHLVGTIEAGKEADLTLWSGHPFDVRSQVEKVWIKGRQLL